VTVSNIPSSCYGDDFTINAFNDSSSTPLALFNTTSTSAVVSNNNGTFSPGIRVSGMTVESRNGSFTATFTTPVALSSSVSKITIQSGLPFVYQVGDRGPGGGFIYYVNDAGFNCGPTYTSTGSPMGGKCKYLEVAPSGWNGGSDPAKTWGNFNQRISSISDDAIDPYNNILGVGIGYKHSLAIISLYGASSTYAAGAARAYAGGSRSDWYLPTTAELNLLCQWVRGIPSDVTTACTGGSVNSSIYGASSAGFADVFYWSSSQRESYGAWAHNFFVAPVSVQQQLGHDRTLGYRVRPIRAF
jgi:hypothetical protein